MWSEYGCTSLALKLAGLPVCGCALMIGAHPDDEDNALLALLSKGMFLDSYYLVATYGEGGQNECGPELYEALGVLRRQELAAARRIDGARQLYLGAHDFGYSKSARETFTKWDRDALLAKTVAALRRTRPDIVLTHHDTVSGHGHHQAVGWLIQEAIQAAADPSRFPEQLKSGLPPWRVKRFYVYARPQASGGSGASGAHSGADAGNQQLATANVGAYSPLLGMSYYQLGQASRSMHKCQGMGGEGVRGDRWRRYRLVLEDAAPPPPTAPAPGASGTAGPVHTDDTSDACGLIDFIDLTLPALVARLNGDEATLARLFALAGEVDASARAAVEAFSPVHPQAEGMAPSIARHLTRGLDAAREMLHIARAGDTPRPGPGSGLAPESAATLSRRVESKVAQFEAALTTLAAAECVVRTDPSPALVAPGGSVNLKVQLWNRGPMAVEASDFRVLLPTDWSCEPRALADAPAASEPVPPNGCVERQFIVTAPFSAQPTPALGPDPVSVECDWLLDFWGTANPTRITTSVPTSVTVVPPVEVALEPQSFMAALGRLPMTQVFSVTLRNNIRSEARGTVRLRLPQGISSLRGDSLDFFMAEAGDETTLSLPVSLSRACEAQRSCVRTMEAEALTNVGGVELVSDQGCQLISYSHIEPRLLPLKATARLCLVDTVLPEGLRVGYVDTGIDNVADYMEQLGASVVRLDDDDLRLRDLGQFDTIVLGVRAYHLRPWLARVNSRLLDYVRRGGTMVVQYHKTTEWDPEYAPYPLLVGDGRVSDETARIELLDAAHPVITGPNRLDETDWDGWVQERGLYFASEWSDEYRPLVSCADPDEASQDGAWLIAHYGAGAYMYTALSVYRQIESLIPGGVRIWCNMISYRQKGTGAIR